MSRSQVTEVSGLCRVGKGLGTTGQDEAWRDASWRQSQQEWVTDWTAREAEGKRGPKDGTPIPVSRADGGAASDSGTHGRYRSAERCCTPLWALRFMVLVRDEPRVRGSASGVVWAQLRGTVVSC